MGQKWINFDQVLRPNPSYDGDLGQNLVEIGRFPESPVLAISGKSTNFGQVFGLKTVV